MSLVEAISGYIHVIKKGALGQATQRGDQIIRFGAIFAFFVILVSSLLHILTKPFTPLSIWVSNLGIGPNGSAFVFNYGLMMTGIMYSIMIGILDIRLKHLSKKMDIALISGSISGITAVVGIFMLTINNMETGYLVHGIGAYMFFICTPIYTTIATFALLFSHPQAPKLLRSQIITGSIILIIFLSMIPASWFGTQLLQIPYWDILANMDSRLGFVRINEWCAVLGFFAWIYVTGVSLKKIEKCGFLFNKV